jgi:hypothetical protein
VRDTAQEYVWLDRAPPSTKPTPAVTAAAAVAPVAGLGGEQGPAGQAAPDQEATGGPAEPCGTIDAITRWAMADESQAKGHGFLSLLRSATNCSLH